MLRTLLVSWSLAAATAAAWAQSEDFISDSALREAGLSKFWQLALPLEEGERLVNAYLVDDQLYFCTYGGYVYAVHADTGAIRWLRRVVNPGQDLRRPCHAGERTIFITPTQMLVVDRLLGQGLAERNLRFPPGTGAVSDGVRYYFGGVNHRFYAFSVDTLYEVWKVQTNRPLSSTPALFGQSIYFAGEDNGVYACTASRKKFQWQAATLAPNTADLVADEKGVYVASRDQSLYLFDLQFGQVRWRARLSGPLLEPPVVTADTAYQYCEDDGLVAVNTGRLEDENQRLRWKLPRGRTALTADEKNIFVLSQDETVLIAGIQDGGVKLTIPAPGMTFALPSPQETALFLAGPDGRIFCARPRNVPFARREDLRKALLPPNAVKAAAAATQPVVEKIPPTPPVDLLKTEVLGSTLGGKSKVSREFSGKAPADAGRGAPPADSGRGAPPPDAGRKPESAPAKNDKGSEPKKP